MKTIQTLLVGAATATAMLVLATTASAQATANATASTNAKIIQPIAISKTADMNFGTLVRPATGSATVTLSTAGAVTGVTSVTGGSNASPAAAKFTVSGEGGQTYTIAENASALSNGTDDLTLTLTKIAGANGSISGNVGTLSNTLGGAGSGDLVYGASFPISSTTSTGAYTGTLQVTVTYN